MDNVRKRVEKLILELTADAEDPRLPESVRSTCHQAVVLIRDMYGIQGRMNL